MSSRTPDELAHRWVAPITDTSTGRMIGVAYGNDRIITRWKPDQAEELKAIGKRMIELAGQLREFREEVPPNDVDAPLGQLDRTS